MYKTQYLGICAIAIAALAIQQPLQAETEESLFDSASRHYAAGQWSEGEADFVRFIEQSPDDEQVPLAMFLQGECLLKQHRYVEAREMYLRSLERDPHHRHSRQAIFRVGESSHLSGNREVAKKELDWFRNEFPDDQLNAYVLTYLAETALDEQDAGRARSLCLQSLKKFSNAPTASQCRFGLARSLDLLGDPDGARSQYQLLIQSRGPLADDSQVQIGISAYNRGLYDVADCAFQAAEAEYPTSKLQPEIGYWRGMTLVARAGWAEAADQFEKGVERYPNHRRAAAMAFWAGECCSRLDDVASAERWYRHVCERWPSSEWADDALLARVEHAFNSNDYLATADLAEQFNQLFPSSEWNNQAQQYYGRALIAQGEFTEAVALFSALVTQADEDSSNEDLNGEARLVDPQSMERYRACVYYLALSYLGNEEYSQALETLAGLRPRAEDQQLRDGILVTRAMAYMGLGQYSEAILPLQSYLAANANGPDAAKCRVQLALAWARMGQLDQAIQQCEQLDAQARLQPAFLPTLYYLADQAYEQKRYADAERLFAELCLADQPADYRAKGRSGLGWTFYRENQLDRAVDEFDRLITDHPSSPLAAEAAMMKAKAMERQGQIEPALDAYLVVVTSYEQSDHSAAALFEAAKLQETAGRKDEAASLLVSVVENNPNFPKMDAALYQLAWLFTELGDKDQANLAFQRLADEHPDSPFWGDALYRLAEAAFQADALDQAAASAQRLVDAELLDETRPHALYLQGQIAAKQGRWDDAAAAMETLIKESPEHDLADAAEYWVAEARYHQQNFEDAAARFARLNRSMTDDAPAWQAMIPLRESQILAQQGRWKAAYVVASKIEKQFPDFPHQFEADYVIGRYFATESRFDEARQRYERAAGSPAGRNTETGAMAQWMIGDSHLRQKNYEEAIAAYSDVLSRKDFPKWQAVSRLQIAKCCLALGESDEAIEWLQQVIDLHAGTDFAEEASQRLERLELHTRTASLN